jgi:hypothetical protein
LASIRERQGFLLGRHSAPSKQIQHPIQDLEGALFLAERRDVLRAESGAVAPCARAVVWTPAPH